jgi:hypothetical protein
MIEGKYEGGQVVEVLAKRRSEVPIVAVADRAWGDGVKRAADDGGHHGGAAQGEFGACREAEAVARPGSYLWFGYELSLSTIAFWIYVCTCLVL